ncbi:hypothetical protein ACRALDRAFT_1068321 [Sodiomyces alcalophilus JCM 7366]|uniref:uncharacterized protein n=1 Tax=Sodiomyces alcalophilus JCM 7366 TaxID=591952 RepID=UPI0039B410AA
MAILSPIDLENLRAQGLVGPVEPNGTRRIHKRRLGRFSDLEYSHIPLSDVSSPEPQDSSISVPEDIISQATLEYIGYNDEMASHLWRKWAHWPPGEPVREVDDFYSGIRFIDFATGHLSGHNVDTFSEDITEWMSCMETCGIARELQDAILDPVFDRVRKTETCVFWLADTMRMRYNELREIQRASLERDKALQREGSPSPTGNTPRTEQHLPSSPREQSSVSMTQRLAPGIEKDTAMSAAAVAAHNTPGYTTLYKGVDPSRIDRLFDVNGNVVMIEALQTTGPTDFRRDAGYYFTTEREIAALHASYAKRRGSVGLAVIVAMDVPNAAMASLSEAQLIRVCWPSPEWKSLIFHCRRGLRVPRDANAPNFKDASIIIGTMSNKPSRAYRHLDSPDQTTEAMVFKTKDGRDAIHRSVNRLGSFGNVYSDRGTIISSQCHSPGCSLWAMTELIPNVFVIALV